jgi:hypothetical protein
MNTQGAVGLLEELKAAHNYTPFYNEALTFAIEHMKRWQWMPIETSPKSKTVFVAYKNDCDKWRIEKACYFKEGTLEADPDNFNEDLYDEDRDNYYAPEGWYIDVEAVCTTGALDYSYLRMYEKPTHWMPLPETLETK